MVQMTRRRRRKRCVCKTNFRGEREDDSTEKWKQIGNKQLEWVKKFYKEKKTTLKRKKRK